MSDELADSNQNITFKVNFMLKRVKSLIFWQNCQAPKMYYNKKLLRPRHTFYQTEPKKVERT